MKRMVKVLVTVAAVLALALVFCGCSVNADTYTPEKKDATVASPAIGKDGVLRVGVNSSNAPFSAQVSGHIVGLDVDVAAALADEMGLSLELVDVGNDAEGALQKGDVDLIMSLATTDTTTSCWESKPYISSSVAIFSMDANAKMPTKESTKNDPIEAQTSSMSAWEVSNQFGDEALKGTSELKTAFTDLSSGSVKYVAADAIIGSYVANSNNISASMIGVMESPSGYCVGVATANSELQKAVTSALENVSKGGIINVIELKWLGLDLNLDTMAKTEGADKADVSKAAAETTTEGGGGGVGANAVSLEDDGSTRQQQ